MTGSVRHGAVRLKDPLISWRNWANLRVPASRRATMLREMRVTGDGALGRVASVARAVDDRASRWTYFPQHLFHLRPLPQGHGSCRPIDAVPAPGLRPA